MSEPPDVLTPKKRGSRIIGVVILVLVILFFAIDYIVRESQEFSPTKATNILLAALQFIVILLAIILLFVLGRNLSRLYLERKRKEVGSHFKTKLVLFFTALSFIPTLMLFFFTSNLINRNIEQWFKMDVNRVLEDTRSVVEGFYVTTSELTLHYAQQLTRAVQAQKLLAPENRAALEAFLRSKLGEYRINEIGVYVNEEELFSILDPTLPLQDYQDLALDRLQRAHLGEAISEIKAMGTGEFVRRGVSFTAPGVGKVVITTGKFLPQNYAQKIASVNAYWERFSQRRQQKDLAKTTYLMTLILITMLIVFAATWIGFHIARGVTVPIEKLAGATREVSKGNLSVRVEDPASDEIGTLIDSFNQMIADLKSGQESIAQKTAEQAARQQYIQALLNTLTTGVIAIDAQGVIMTLNPSARDMLALPGDDALGRSFRDVLGHERYGELAASIEAGIRGRHRIADREIQIVLNGQATTFSLSLAPLRPPGRDFSGLIIVLDDLTQLIKAQRIAAWKEVAQRVAHEIKNPLTPIQLNAERILRTLRKRDAGAGAVIEEGAQVILQEAQSIKSLVDEFSEFARLPKINLQPASLSELIQNVVALFRPIFAEVEFDVAFDPAVPASLALDTEQMKRVFINLIDNAIDAMNKKGKIAIHAVLDREAQEVRIEVADSGPGIPVEDKERLFLPHFSTKKKGRGLGLAIVNQIMKEHQGAIDAQNAKPHGAKFTLHLPA